RLIVNHPNLASFESVPEVRALPSAGITRLRRYRGPVRLPPGPPPETAFEVATSDRNGSAPITRVALPACRAHYPDGSDGCSRRPLPRPRGPSPNLRRVGIHDFTFESCSGFTRITARRIAQPPEGAFVTRLQPGRLPRQTARQLPGPSTTSWVEPSSTGN